MAPVNGQSIKPFNEWVFTVMSEHLLFTSTSWVSTIHLFWAREKEDFNLLNAPRIGAMTLSSV
jgi:hypothetical protein